MSSAVLLFAARALLLLLLYVFLYLVVQALRQDLRRSARHAEASRPAAPSPRPGARAPRLRGGRRVATGLRLEVIDAGQTPLPLGECFPLRDPLLIGRAPANDIALEDDWISAQHVRLRRQKGAWLAEDLGSTNGTRVNGHPLTGAVRVRAGDVLDLGRVKLKLVGQP